RSATKGALRGTMPARADPVRAADAFDLVRRLPGAVVMKGIQERFGIDLARGFPARFADGGDPPAFREVILRLFRRLDDGQFEMPDPRTGRRLGRLVPVVGRLEKKQPRFLTRRVDHVTVRYIDDRNPQLEMRVGAKRIRVVVEKRVMQRA